MTESVQWSSSGVTPKDCSDNGERWLEFEIKISKAKKVNGKGKGQADRNNCDLVAEKNANNCARNTGRGIGGI